MPPGDHAYQLSFAGRNYVLYQHSYLGYGLVEARKQLTQMVLESLKTQKIASKKTHPCYPLNHTQVIQLDGEAEEITLEGSWVQKKCKGLVNKLFKKEETCQVTCGLAGIYQPRLKDLRKEQIFYAFSFFYDQISPLVGGRDRISIKELRGLTEAVCIGNSSKFSNYEDAILKLKSHAGYCLDLSYIYGLLSYGYGFPEERQIQLVKKIRGVETGWCLGAAFSLVDIP
eukprot:TRINITY_DN5640_c0_g1_i1.p1 TRINITY_DN5640_c0_g1~~TRINITY_DN5640_c0_g1_i1.p1  ORF type:complete len:228 (+),score=30.61 TRINITY_DN5640_c0_g1_i1:232-915(+)